MRHLLRQAGDLLRLRVLRAVPLAVILFGTLLPRRVTSFAPIAASAVPRHPAISPAQRRTGTPLAQPVISSAQTERAGFVMTLGRDTVQLEQFQRTGNRIEGVIATRSPSTRLVQYSIEVGADGRMVSYSQRSGVGALATPDPMKASFVFAGDSVIRETMQQGQPVTHRILAPDGAFPFNTIPLGSSFLVLEFALAKARATGMTGNPALVRLGAFAGQTQPSRTPVLYASKDSVDVDYFGQGRFGTTFDTRGRLIRSDWRGTTYKTLIVRVSDVDPAAAAKLWSAQDAAGNGFGRLSLRDTLRVAAGGAQITIDYSRPAVRGRTIWGEVVPSDIVWRLGADFATQLTTSADLQIGDYSLPAGAYTLWMLPSDDAPLLIINKQTGIFGTQYNAAHDLVRIPLTREAVASHTERLTIAIGDSQLRIAWADRTYSVPLRDKQG